MIETGSGSPAPTSSDTRALPCIVPLPYYPYPPYLTHYLGGASDPLKYLGSSTDPLKYLGSPGLQDQVRLYLAQEQLKYSPALKVTQNLLSPTYQSSIGNVSHLDHGGGSETGPETSSSSSRGTSVFTIESLLAPRNTSARLPPLHHSLPRAPFDLLGEYP